MKRNTIVILGASVCAILLCWGGIAAARLHRAQSGFAKTSPSQSDQFFASASLCTWRSLSPLIKNPFRKDIRLYFVHKPKINIDGIDAWASNERGSWELKLHN